MVGDALESGFFEGLNHDKEEPTNHRRTAFTANAGRLGVSAASRKKATFKAKASTPVDAKTANVDVKAVTDGQMRQPNCAWQAYVTGGNEGNINAAFPDSQCVYQVLVMSKITEDRIFRVSGTYLLFWGGGGGGGQQEKRPRRQAISYVCILTLPFPLFLPRTTTTGKFPNKGTRYFSLQSNNPKVRPSIPPSSFPFPLPPTHPPSHLPTSLSTTLGGLPPGHPPRL